MFIDVVEPAMELSGASVSVMVYETSPISGTLTLPAHTPLTGSRGAPPPPAPPPPPAAGRVSLGASGRPHSVVAKLGMPRCAYAHAWKLPAVSPPAARD